MRYKDFKIRIEGKRGDGYNVSVESPAGNSEEHIVFDFDAASISGQIKQLGRTVRGVSRDVEIDISDGPSPAEIGEQLFNALFQGSIAKMYYQSYRDLTDPEVGLRIKLHLNLNDPDVSALAAVPWEYIREAANMEYLILSRQTPLVRFLDVQRPNSVLPLKDSLRVLVVMSNPAGVHQLDLEAEKKLIEESWAKEPGVDVEFLTKPTPERLLQKLGEADYHVLHYMGHGAHDPNTGIGGLVLEDDDGNAEIMDAETLGRLLRNEPTLRLVFLNACDTARTDEQRPFAGVTNRLVMAGVPAVVAMQFPISDAAAITFAKAFYSSLVSGAPVDEATTFGRMAITVGEPGSLEWGTPVLCMRSPDGRLFELTKTAPADVPATAAAAAAPAPATAAPQTAAPGGKSGASALKMGLGAGAVLVAAALAWFVFAPQTDSGDFRWDPPAPELEVGVPKKIRLQLVSLTDSGEESIRPYSRNYAVEVRADGSNLSAPKRTAEKRWEWETTATDVGSAALEATIVNNAGGDTPDDPVLIRLPVEVKVGDRVAQQYQAAIAAIEAPATATSVALSQLAALDKPALLSADMRSTLDRQRAAMQELLDLQNAAQATVNDDASTLTEKITALEAWRASFSKVRYDPASGNGHSLQQTLEELKARSNIDRIILCGSYNKCADSTARLKKNAPVYVSTKPAADGLSCNISGPQDKPCTIGNSYRTLNVAGNYTVTVRNAEGDLLAQQPLEIY